MKGTVREVMSSGVVTIESDAGFKDVVSLLEEHRFGALPVVEEGKLVGIISETDLVLKEERLPAEDHENLARFRTGRSFFTSRRRERDRVRGQAGVAEELMTRDLETIGPDEPLAEAARRMRAGRISQLPVVDDSGDLVGIVARSDLLKVYLRSDEDIHREILHEVVGPVRQLTGDSVQVAVRAGEVTLTGTLQNRSDAARLVSRVRNVPGVVWVNDELRTRYEDVSPDEARQMLPQM